ncbi:Stk1 family PASTA domain-containing Ser/Thr kinase [Ectobacillus funiculus]|uniref:Stk1 family PASTA domain-containing Ser/Thr kinase n=1 Tax=Ectobacillus funiculus TaxID=137993 RepID=UPI00101C7183|nr:Stk1 family PASTA domain-containing Ser/Thr kinase [Ectobacillus funiculus]
MMIGKRLNDRYKLLKVIGGGGMANVYLGHDVILDREVAVKILRLDYSNNEEFIKRFHREAQSVTSLSHPNVVNIYDVGEEDGIYYLVMEYVPGQTLKQYIQQQGMLSVRESLDIMEQLTSAMAHAHHFEIVHRDIKPQNILIRDDGLVKVTDFGIATATSATTITHTNSVLGSVHYLSPEQARGGIANKKSDIYSLGIVMFELLTGRPPFSGESAVSIALKHLQNETPSPKRWNPDIPQSVENIILKATSKDPFHRYDSVNEMKEDIMTALYPERANEERFSIPDDMEATKAIPIIRQEAFQESASDETIIMSGKWEGAKKEPESEPEEQPKKVKKKKKVWQVLLTLVLLLGLGGAFAVTVVPKLFAPKEVAVPDVTGKPYEEAVTTLVAKGFDVTSPQIIYSDEVAEGDTIKTSPEAGKIVKENTKITIFKSGGKKKKEMQQLIGLQYDSIKASLAAQYANVVTYYTESEQAKGQILDQFPKAGDSIIEKEQEVRIWISEGPKRMAVADFTGWTESSVNNYASEKNLVTEFKQDYSDKVEKGMVISQDPKAGTLLKEGDKISIVISAGAKEKPRKTVTISNITIPYEPAESKSAESKPAESKPAESKPAESESAESGAAGSGTETPAQESPKPQTVEIYKEDAEHTMERPVETRTITATTTISIDLLIEYEKSARYKIVRDGTTIVEKEIPYPAD